VKYFFQFLLPGFLISMKATAQGQVVKKVKSECYKPVKDQINSQDPILPGKVMMGVSFSVITLTERKMIISGKVSNENNEGIPYATVTINNVVTVADSVGNYKTTISAANLNIHIKASSAGYFSKEIHREATHNPIQQDLILKADDVLNEIVMLSYATKEKVMTTYGVVVKQSKKSMEASCSVTMGSVVSGVRVVNETNRDISKQIPSNEMKLYPNPIKPNSTMHIAWDQKETGDFDLQFFNSSGQLVFKKQLYIDEDARVLSIDLPFLIAGNYFLKMTNRSTSKSYNAKIIVQ
jgi:hypothetical protein